MREALRCRATVLAILISAAAPSPACAETQVLYNLSLNGNLWGNRFDSFFQFEDRFRLSSLNLNLSSALLRAHAGDVSANWDELGFAHRSFRGLELGFPTGKLDTGLIGGVIVMPGILGQQEVSGVYGLRAGWPLGRDFRLVGTHLLAPGTGTGTGTGTEGRAITTAGLKYQPSSKAQLSMELARSTGGFGWQISGASEGNQVALQASYRRVSPGFSSSGNPLLRTNRNGVFANLRYRISRPLTFVVTTQRYDDGVGGALHYDSAEIQLSSQKLPSLALVWQSGSDRHGVDETTQTAVRSLGLRLSQSFRHTHIFFQADRFKFRVETGSVSNNASNRYSLGLSHRLSRGSLLTFYHGLDLGRDIEGGGSNRGQYSVIELNQSLGRSGTSVIVGLTQQHSRFAGEAGRSLGIRAGFRVPMGSGSSMGMDYQTNLGTSGILRSHAPNVLQITHYQRIQAGRRTAAQIREESLAERERRQFGRLTGRVFEDSNGNLQWDAGEAGLPGVMVALETEEYARTNNAGGYSITSVYPGEHLARLALRTLPVEFTPMTSTDVTVEVPRMTVVTVDFPVTRTGLIRGIVFWDQDRDGKLGPDEKGVADATVRVEGSDIMSFTDARGVFVVHGLPPRRWKIRVDLETIGEDYEGTGEGFAEVAIPAGGEVTGVGLGVAPIQRPIRKTFERNR